MLLAVGRLDVGPRRLTIRPKLPALPLGILLRYAYDLRDIGLHDPVPSGTEQWGLPDLLAARLADEAEDLLRHGLGV